MVYRRTIAGFAVLLCKVARPLYSSSQKPAVQNLRGFCLISAGGFNLSHLSYAASVPTLNVACHMCSDEQHFDCTWDYMHLYGFTLSSELTFACYVAYAHSKFSSSLRVSINVYQFQSISMTLNE